MVNTTNKLVNAQNDAATGYKNNITHIAIGSNGTVPISSNTTLGTETFRDVAENIVRISNIVRTDIRLDVTENNGNFQREIGSFNDSVAGVMNEHNLLTPFDKTSSKEAFYRITTTFTGRNE